MTDQRWETSFDMQAHYEEQTGQRWSLVVEPAWEPSEDLLDEPIPVSGQFGVALMDDNDGIIVEKNFRAVDLKEAKQRGVAFAVEALNDAIGKLKKAASIL